MMKITLNKDRRIITINPSIMTHLVEKVSMLKSKTCKPAVVMKRCEEIRNVIVKTENDKIFRRNRQHLCQGADSNGTDDTIVISDGEEENSKEQEVIVKLEELEMDLSKFLQCWQYQIILAVLIKRVNKYNILIFYHFAY